MNYEAWVEFEHESRWVATFCYFQEALDYVEYAKARKVVVTLRKPQLRNRGFDYTQYQPRERMHGACAESEA